MSSENHENSFLLHYFPNMFFLYPTGHSSADWWIARQSNQEGVNGYNEINVWLVVKIEVFGIHSAMKLVNTVSGHTTAKWQNLPNYFKNFCTG